MPDGEEIMAAAMQRIPCGYRSENNVVQNKLLEEYRTDVKQAFLLPLIGQQLIETAFWNSLLLVVPDIFLFTSCTVLLRREDR